MTEKTSFLKALMQHTMLTSETISDFRREYNKLTSDDKAWFRERLMVEYDYTFSE